MWGGKPVIMVASLLIGGLVCAGGMRVPFLSRCGRWLWTEGRRVCHGRPHIASGRRRVGAAAGTEMSAQRAGDHPGGASEEGSAIGSLGGGPDPLPSAPAAVAAKVYWRGRHSVLGYSSPLGKLHRQGLQHLVELGWREITRDEATAPPAFAWTTRGAADFPAEGPSLPMVRQLPQSCTACLDDKVLLARLAASDEGLRAVCPRTLVDCESALRELQDPRGDWGGPGGMGEGPRRWFVKHRRGVKGQAVRALRRPDLEGWLREQVAEGEAAAARGARRGNGGGPPEPQFVVQEEVAPPALWEGRRFAVRCHALVAARGGAGAEAWLHRDVIVLPYAARHDPESDRKAVHVSQAGSGHPPPSLSSDLPPGHPAAGGGGLWPRLEGLARACIRAAGPSLVPERRCGASTLYSVLALDVALDRGGGAWLLEVNSHCAVGGGTMAAVPAEVYTRLIADVVSLLVVPALEGGGGGEPGGFVALEGCFPALP